MKYVRTGGFYQLRLAKGEDILEALVGFVRRHDIKSGFFTGIGAAEDVVLGLYEPKKKVYVKRTFKGDCEIANIVGNVAWDGKDPICHTHATISTPKLVAFAGHLFAGRVSVTCEVALVPGTRRLRRALEPAIGLKLLQLPG